MTYYENRCRQLNTQTGNHRILATDNSIDGGNSAYVVVEEDGSPVAQIQFLMDDYNGTGYGYGVTETDLLEIVYDRLYKKKDDNSYLDSAKYYVHSALEILKGLDLDKNDNYVLDLKKIRNSFD